MVTKILRKKLLKGGMRRRRLNLLAAALAVTTFLPASLTYAAEEIPAPVEEVELSDETAVEAETNEAYLHYLEMEDWFVSAERIPTNKWDTPSDVYIITAQEIEENHYQNVEEAVAHVPGLVSLDGGVEINGGDRVLVLIDGHRLISPQNTDNFNQKSFTAHLPSMKIVERIEILKGGNSALYGSDGFNGIINIITKKGTKNETTIDVNTGTWRRHNYELTNQGSVGKFGWFVAGNLSKSQEEAFRYGDGNVYNRAGSDYSNKKFWIRLDNRFTDRSSLTLDYLHASNHYDISNIWSDFNLFNEGLYEGRKHGNLYNNVSLTYNFKEGTSTPGWFRYINNYYTFTDVGTEDPNARLQGIEYQNGWELGQHRIITGFEYHKDTASYALYGYKDKSIKTKSAYVQDTISMGDKWKFVPGVRYDHSSEFGNNWSPKVAVNYRPDEKTKFYASWGRSYSVPLLRHMYSGFAEEGSEDFERLFTRYYFLSISNNRLPLGGFNEWNDGRGSYGRSLRAEKGDSFTIGLEHDFDEKKGLAVKFFQNKLKNQIEVSNEPSDLDYSDFGTYDNLSSFHALFYGENNEFVGEKLEVYPYTNGRYIKNRGVAIDYKQKIDDHFSYNLSYMHTHTDNPAINRSYTYPNSYRVGLRYENRGLKANLHAIMGTGGYKDDWISGKYGLLNFNLSYDTSDSTTFYFKALNFTNQCYVTGSTYNSEVYYRPSRAFLYGMRYKF